MLKRMLTLFAILTGLAAVAAPVQARVSMIEDIGVHAAGESAAQCQNQRSAVQSRPVTALPSRKSQASPCRPVVVTILIPTVMLKADRARE